MSIKNDPEFVDLLLRYGFEIAETERAYQRYCGRQSSSELQNYLLPKEKAELTYQYIYTYIDKYVQEEIAKQKAFDRLQHIYEKNDEAIKHFKKQESKISELQPDDSDICYSFDGIINGTFYSNLIVLLKKELFLINKLILNVSGFDISIHFDSCDIITITLEFCHTYPYYPFHTVWNRFVETFSINYSPHINITKLAQRFIEKIDKAVLEHAPK